MRKATSLSLVALAIVVAIVLLSRHSPLSPLSPPSRLSPFPPNSITPPRGKLLWGAETTTEFVDPPGSSDVHVSKNLAQTVGKAPSIVPFNLPFEGCSTSCNDYTFPLTQMNAVNAYGAITMLNWSSMSSPLHTNEPAFNLAKVADGAFDSYIRTFARAAKQWGHPFLLRFDWEMNGDWFPWGARANGNTPAEYVAAWRHVHNIFTSVGATNATWVWCPNVDFQNNLTSLTKVYPGSRYVDWTCMDGYNVGNLNGPGGWRSFNQIFASTYQKIIQLAPTKPMLIGETGSSEGGGSKANWITDMFNQLPRYRKIRGLVYYDQYAGADDWPLSTSRSAVNAFKAGIANPAYQSNTYANLKADPIPAP